MSSQVRCPNDGGDKVSDETEVLDARTGLPFQPLWPMAKIVRGALLFFFGSIAVIGAALTIWGLINRDAANDGLAGAGRFIFVWALFLFAVVLVPASWGKQGQRVALSSREKAAHERAFAAQQPVTLHRYYCLLCGKHWQWREDQPYPYPTGTPLPVNAAGVRRLGEQRLAEEAQEAVRQREYYEWYMRYMWNIYQQRSRDG